MKVFFDESKDRQAALNFFHSDEVAWGQLSRSVHSQGGIAFIAAAMESRLYRTTAVNRIDEATGRAPGLCHARING